MRLQQNKPHVSMLTHFIINVAGVVNRLSLKATDCECLHYGFLQLYTLLDLTWPRRAAAQVLMSTSHSATIVSLFWEVTAYFWLLVTVSLSLHTYLLLSASLLSVDVTAFETEKKRKNREWEKDRERQTEGREWEAQLPPQTETLWLWDREEFRRVGVSHVVVWSKIRHAQLYPIFTSSTENIPGCHAAWKQALYTLLSYWKFIA